jgi:hypothetical protein
VRHRRRLSNPSTQRRLGIGLIALGGVLAGLGAFVRAVTMDGSASHSAAYLLDSGGWLAILAGAVVEARAAQLFLMATPGPARRRAVLFWVLGLLAGLAGCVLASTASGDDAPALVPAGAMFVLVSGVGFGLTGFFSLAWFYGGEYAGRRIEKLSDEEW